MQRSLETVEMSAQKGPTELSILESDAHGQARREERGIQMIDLQRARWYGMKKKDPYGHLSREKYTYGGIVFIYDRDRNREVTTWQSSDISLVTSGAQAAEPILLAKFCRNFF